MSTFTTIQDIFYSGSHAFNGDPASINELSFLINEGYLKLKQISIAHKNEYLALLDNPAHLEKQYEAAGGGLAHVAIKILTGKYLVEKRDCSVLYEHPFCGYFPDVLTTDHLIVAECGHTQNSEKVFTYFQQSDINEFLQIPYPWDTDTNLTGYSFERCEYLNDFLNELEKTKRNNIKKLIQRKR